MHIHRMQRTYFIFIAVAVTVALVFIADAQAASGPPVAYGGTVVTSVDERAHVRVSVHGRNMRVQALPGASQRTRQLLASANVSAWCASMDGIRPRWRARGRLRHAEAGQARMRLNRPITVADSGWCRISRGQTIIADVPLGEMQPAG
jgi:hypothetical protein